MRIGPFTRWLATLAFCCALTPALGAETLRIGMDLNYPPFSWQDENGAPQGFDPDIAQALCRAMKVECRIVPQDWDGLTKALYLGKFDAILSSMQITEERQKSLDFSKKYYHAVSRIVAPVGASVSRKSFAGKRIGVLRGSTQARFARVWWGAAGAVIVDYDKIGAAFSDMLAHRLSAVFVDNVVGDSTFLQGSNAHGFAFVGPAYDDPRYFGMGAGIAVRKGDNRLRARLNQAIDRIRQDGSYQRIEKKYFSFDIYGQ